jgi:hypothetical protein
MLLEDELVTEEHHAKSLLQVVPPVVAFDFESDSDPAVHVAVAAGSEDGVITNLCRIPRHSHSDTQFATEVNILRDRPGYRNDNDTADGANEYDDDENDDHDDGDDDDDDDGNMLPSRAELAAEERMLWRMADTPIPTESG